MLTINVIDHALLLIIVNKTACLLFMTGCDIALESRFYPLVYQFFPKPNIIIRKVLCQ